MVFVDKFFMNAFHKKYELLSNFWKMMKKKKIEEAQNFIVCGVFLTLIYFLSLQKFLLSSLLEKKFPWNIREWKCELIYAMCDFHNFGLIFAG